MSIQRFINRSRYQQQNEVTLQEEDIQIDNDTRNQEFESVFNKIDLFLDNSKFSRRNSGRSRSEGINIIFGIKVN